MKVPNGDTVTQFDLHDCEDASLIKIDLLSVECLDKIHNCIDLLCEYGKIERKATLKETYENVIGIYNLERLDPKMWEMVWDHKIQSLFQMEKQSGIQGIALIKPKSVDELAVLNSVIRLMPSDKNSERPLDLWAKYRSNIKLWYNEMKYYGLTDEEIAWLGNHSAVTDEICESQEGLMSLVQEPRLGGNSLNFADRCRKGIAKKQGKLFDECEKEFYTNIKKNNCSEKLAHYVWDVMLKVQRGYSFNRSHCLAYSLVALQEMNLAYKFPLIYWNTACLITDTGGNEDIEGSNDYGKLADGINKMRDEGIDVALPDINESTYTFKPDEVNNKIIFGLRGILSLGDEIINNIIANRPYKSFEDFKSKVKVNKTVMLSLIKAGVFDSLEDRKSVMTKYIYETADTKKNLNITSIPLLMKNNLLPMDNDDYKMAYRIYEFNRYLKAKCSNGIIDNRAFNFLTEIDCEDLVDGNMKLNEKGWQKFYSKAMDIYRDYIASHKEELLAVINEEAFVNNWSTYAEGSLSAWEMEAICFYYHEHEMAHLNHELYGISSFKNLPEEPEVDYTYYTKDGKEVNIFKLTKIAGTCISKNKNKGTVKILTVDGVVEVRFRKEYFAMFDKQVSIKGADGKKHVVESSWFNKGEKIMVNGMRQGDQFTAKKYKTTEGHTLYRILQIEDDGKLVLQSERAQGELNEI